MSTTDPVARLLDALNNVKPNGTGHTARCPGHDDRHNSLKVDTGKDGQALIHCHAGCEPQHVVRALGWTLADLYPARSETAHQTATGGASSTWGRLPPDEDAAFSASVCALRAEARFSALMPCRG